MTSKAAKQQTSHSKASPTQKYSPAPRRQDPAAVAERRRSTCLEDCSGQASVECEKHCLQAPHSPKRRNKSRDHKAATAKAPPPNKRSHTRSPVSSETPPPRRLFSAPLVLWAHMTGAGAEVSFGGIAHVFGESYYKKLLPTIPSQKTRNTTGHDAKHGCYK